MDKHKEIIVNEKMILKVKEAFSSCFGREAGKIYFAPGRVNLIGEHTDYNGGHVFPCALSLGTYGAALKREDDNLRFFSVNFERNGILEGSLSNLTPLEDSSWASYVKGVIWAFREAGHRIPFGIDMVVGGDIPAGSGLSSSASLEVLSGLILQDLFNLEGVSGVDLALLGQKAENDFNGMHCGIMDQFASAMGKNDQSIFLDTSTMEYSYAPLSLGREGIVITNSNVKHSLVTSAYNDRRRECEEALELINDKLKDEGKTGISALGDLSPLEFDRIRDLIKLEKQKSEKKTDTKDDKIDIILRRARHAVYENARTAQAVKALEKGDIPAFGKLMIESHVSLRDDYEVSCKEIDFLVETALNIPGVIGSRITGGGFGGCTVSIIDKDYIERYKEEIAEKYLAKTGIKCEFYEVSAGEGARILHEVERSDESVIL